MYLKWEANNQQYPNSTATVSDVVDHITHVIKVVGIDHVGIGTDFDGGGGLTDCYDVSEMSNITLELIKRGFTEQQVGKIWGGQSNGRVPWRAACGTPVIESQHLGCARAPCARPNLAHQLRNKFGISSTEWWFFSCRV